MTTGETIGFFIQGISLAWLVLMFLNARQIGRKTLRWFVGIGISASAVGCVLVWVY